MHRKFILVVVVGLAVALLVTGCAAEPVARQSGASEPEPMVMETVVVEKAPQEMPAAPNVENLGEEVERKIIYTGDLSLVVKDTEAAEREIAALVKEKGGYIASADSYTVGEGSRRVSLSLRVPAAAFDDVMASLRGLAVDVTRESISTQDVTQEYVDLESRLRALEAKAARLEELMDQAEDTEAVLAVYKELSSTQVQIEETKGRMRYLARRAAMATINVELTPDELARPVEIAGWHPTGTVKRAIEALIRTFEILMDALIWIILVVVPVTAFVVLIVLGILRLLRLLLGLRRGQRKKKMEGVEASK